MEKRLKHRHFCLSPLRVTGILTSRRGKNTPLQSRTLLESHGCIGFSMRCKLIFNGNGEGSEVCFECLSDRCAYYVVIVSREINSLLSASEFNFSSSPMSQWCCLREKSPSSQKITISRRDQHNTVVSPNLIPHSFSAQILILCKNQHHSKNRKTSGIMVVYFYLSPNTIREPTEWVKAKIIAFTTFSHTKWWFLAPLVKWPPLPRNGVLL